MIKRYHLPGTKPRLSQETGCRLPDFRNPHSPPRLCRTGTSRSGFTLIELLAAILILAVLAVLLIAGITVWTDRALTVGCTLHMRTYGNYVLQYALENKGVLVDNSPIPDDPPGNRNANFSNWNSSLTHYYGWSTREQREFLCPKHVRMAAKAGGAIPTQSFSRPDWLRYSVKDSSGNVTGYGYWSIYRFTNRSQIIYMGDGAMLSSYGGSNNQQGIHDTGNAPKRGTSYRHTGKANFWFLDGHIELLSPAEYSQYDGNKTKFIQ